jgi:hypothetical protein
MVTQGVRSYAEESSKKQKNAILKAGQNPVVIFQSNNIW